MSSGEIWYFVRGQETMGPFSVEAMRQIHGDGQLSSDTLVWREGMEGWKPAAEVAELGLVSPGPVASAPPPPAAGPVAAAPRLKLKLRDHLPSHVPAETPQPVQAVPSSPVLSVAVRDSEPTDKGSLPTMAPRDGPTWWQRTRDRFFSSIVFTPLFFIAAGALVFAYRSHFPNVLGFIWLTMVFAVFGVLALAGVRGLDGLFRFLGLSLLAPPLVLLWPMLMREIPFHSVPPAHWIFGGLCLLYLVTLRIGLRAYLGGLAGLACVTGILTLVFLLAVGRFGAGERIPGWNDLVRSGGEVRLPGPLARWINKPEWGTRQGWLRLKFGGETFEQGIESAVLKRSGQAERRLILRTLDGLCLVAKIAVPAEGFEKMQLVGQDWPLFPMEGAISSTNLEEFDLSDTKVLAVGGKQVRIASATLRVTRADGTSWSGELSFVPESGGGAGAVPLSGSFQTQVILLP